MTDGSPVTGSQFEPSDMFIDNPTIPSRLEVLLEVLHAMQGRKADRDTLHSLMQPDGLPNVSANSAQTKEHISAGESLGLIEKDAEGNFRLTYKIRGEHDAKNRVIAAFEATVLAKPAVEPWFARMYAFLLQMPPTRVAEASLDDLAIAFMKQLPADIPPTNPVNRDKLRLYLRWYVHCGLGWLGPKGEFVADPTTRLERALPAIFGKEVKLEAAEFMSRVGAHCPELDGGNLFRDMGAAWYSQNDRVCTVGFASALRNLHDEGGIRLRCPRDSKGWDLAGAGHVNEPGSLDSDRFDQIEYRTANS